MFAEVHFPEGHLVQELEAERELRLVDHVGLTHRVRRAVHQGLADVEPALPLVRVIGNAAVAVQGPREDRGQLQHLAHAATVAPHRVPTARAVDVVVARRQGFGVRALPAEPPRLGLDLGDVHLVHHHPATLGIEGVVRRQFGDGRCAGALVLEGQRVGGATARLGFAHDDRPQQDTLLRECVVRQQAFVGQHVEGRLPFNAADQARQRRALLHQTNQLGFVFLAAHGHGLQLLDFFRRAFPLAFELVHVLRNAVELVDDLPAQRAGFVFTAVDELRQPGLGRLGQRVPVGLIEQANKAVQQLAPVLLHVVEPGVWKLRHRLAANRTEHGANLTRYRCRLTRLPHPAVQREGSQLPLQHRRCIQEDARRIHAAGHHLPRFFPEEQVVRPARRHGHQQRIARAAASAAGTLHVVGLLRWHRTQQRGRQVTDVDAHLECGRCRQHIDAARPVAVGLEVALHPFTRFARQQARVLVCHHALDLGGEVQLAIKVTPAAVGMQVAFAARAPTRLVFEVFRQAR